MDGPRLARPALPEVDSRLGQLQLGIMFDIYRIVLHPLFLHEKDERVFFTVSRSGYHVYWAYVKKFLFGNGC